MQTEHNNNVMIDTVSIYIDKIRKIGYGIMILIANTVKQAERFLKKTQKVRTPAEVVIETERI